MDSPPKKSVTIRSEPWSFNLSALKFKPNSFLQSPLFGSESTQFFWRAGTNYKLHLYLATSQEATIEVDLILNCDGALFSLNGTVSLDMNAKVEWNQYIDTSCVISTVITFQEIEGKNNQLEHYESLSAQLNNLRLNSDHLADITILTTVDQRKFPAHKAILSARSPVFAAMFKNNGFLENEKGQVKIDDINGGVMESVLDYLYTAKSAKLHEKAEDLLQVADKYDIPLLGKACGQAMLANLSVENAAQFFYLADLYHLDDAKRGAMSFITENRKALRESLDWKKYIGLEQMVQLYEFI